MNEQTAAAFAAAVLLRVRLRKTLALGRKLCYDIER